MSRLELEQAIDALQRLPEKAQTEVIEFIYAHGQSPLVRGNPEDLAKLFGILPDAIGDEMIKAIEESCEQIDENEWRREP
jgi:hypothetical protein